MRIFKKRNISYHFQIGCDRSRNLLGVCRDRKFEAVNADCRRTPARDGCADAVICNVIILYLLLYFENDPNQLCYRYCGHPSSCFRVKTTRSHQ